jgi:hypothetical protein
MRNWRGYLMLSILGAMLLTLIIGIPYSMYKDNNCSKLGGRPTRIGCANADIFLNE